MVAELVSSALVQALMLSSQELQPGETAEELLAPGSREPGWGLLREPTRAPGILGFFVLKQARDVCFCAEKQQVFRPSEGRDSLVQLIKLCEDPNLVGVKLLEALKGVPLRELTCSEWPEGGRRAVLQHLVTTPSGPTL